MASAAAATSVSSILLFQRTFITVLCTDPQDGLFVAYNGLRSPNCPQVPSPKSRQSHLQQVFSSTSRRHNSYCSVNIQRIRSFKQFQNYGGGKRRRKKQPKSGPPLHMRIPAFFLPIICRFSPNFATRVSFTLSECPAGLFDSFSPASVLPPVTSSFDSAAAVGVPPTPYKAERRPEMKLSVSAFRAQASAQRKILSSYQNQLNYGACTSFPAVGGYALEEKAQMMVDSTAVTPANAASPPQCGDHANDQSEPDKMDDARPAPDPLPSPPKRQPLDKSPARTRTKSNQRWMKLRTTVQLSGAITSTNQKSKAPLKREDSFLKRFSTRQIPETQETVDTGDETEPHNGSQAQNEVNRRRRRRRKEMSKTVVNPDENFYFYWLMTVAVCVLYNLWTLIVRQSFPELQKAASAFWYSGDGFTDIVFVCDIMVQFRTGYLEQGLMVYNSKKLASHYLKSRAFVLDTLSLLPLDFLQLNVGVNPLLRFPRFLKVYRVYNYYYMVESRTVYPNLWRVVNLIHILLILAHWFGCFYYLLSEAEGFHGDWVYPHRPGEYATLTRKYLASLYWSTLTLTTIGDLPTPETNAESRGRSKAMTSSGQSEAIPRRGHKSRLLQFSSNYGYLFTIVSYLIGVFIFATIVGQVGNVITNRNANRLEFERLLDGAKTYMRHHKVPGGMKRRVLRWYDYSWSRGRIQGGGDINTALGLLPDKLKTELALHVNLSVLKKVTIFQECQPEFLHDLVLKMKAYIFTPGDLICRKGEVAREMFIIADGILDVISDTGRVLTTMKAGDFFGEIGILNLDGLNKRTADVRSVGYSELFSLSREDVLTAMKDYPEAQEILQSLGRKRLMEAKNASKMYKAQVRQSKEHDSSGESDTAGKRIVEKLRSDVKGLKKALRRSRRSTRTKGGDGVEEISREKSKKQSLLRRMSHVQSSDECETANDQEQTPIGAGLPLLQRLKMLKEKQEREAEEKENIKKGGTIEGSPMRRGENTEAVGSSLPFGQKLKLMKEGKQKEMKEAMLTVSGLGVVPSTVRTQVIGTQLDRTSAKTRTFTSPRPSPEIVEEEKDPIETVRIPLKERLKLIQPKEKTSPARTVPKEGTVEPETHSKTSSNVPTAPEADNSVPKPVRNALDVPVKKNGWKLLKKSSISGSKSERKPNAVRKVSQRGAYLSKSDTVLERQKTIQRDEEKRSRSISPSNCSQTESEETCGERRRSRSVGHSPKAKDDGWQFDSSSSEPTAPPQQKNPKKMKKYNSISDLSPEYSGLSFVKKLKILNERQKLEELEKELGVRSMSLDRTSERQTSRNAKVLLRSQSEACTTDYRSGESDLYRRAPLQSDCRGDDKRSISRSSEGSIASPESNETLERRHLKSILKKLSGEGSTSDEDKTARNLRKDSSSAKRHDEFRKLMREPTLEGYVARHKKLTKSVTFDSDTLPSPLDAVLEQPLDETKGKPALTSTSGYSPRSPTAILTLQLSNLSMMPIAGPKKPTITEGQTDGVQCKLEEEEQDVDSIQNKQKQYLLMTGCGEEMEMEERKIAVLPFGNQKEELMSEMEREIAEMARGLWERVVKKLGSQFISLEAEVKKRDEIIALLQSKILDMERRHLEVLENQGQILDKNSEGSGPNSEFSDVPFLRELSCETVWDAQTPYMNDSRDETYPQPPPDSPQDDSSFYLTKEDAKPEWEPICDTKDNICLIQAHPDIPGKPPEEEMELREWGKWFRETKKQKKGAKGGNEGSKGGFMSRMSRFQRSMSTCREAEFIALDIEDSSSDVEDVDNKDWEVQMLVEELAKNDPYWKAEEPEVETDVDDMQKLREEVNTLKRVVCDSDLTRLTTSELDILESIIDAKDKKILQIAKSSSLDEDRKKEKPKRVLPTGQTKKCSLKNKIGKALSFDFHDIDSRKPKVPKKHRRSCLKTQKTIGSHREHQSLYNLWRTSAHLRNRVLDESDRIPQTSRSSLPILVSPSNHDDGNTFRTSLPLLPAAPTFCECNTPSVSSFEDPHEEPEMSDSAPSVSGTLRSNDATSSLNSFIKSVGQRVRQAMVGDMNTVRSQVPTISKLLEEQSSLKGAEGGMTPQEDVSESSKVVGCKEASGL